MLRAIAILFLITLIPGLELRASIPAGILGGEYIDVPLPWPAVAFICLISNILIGWGVFFALEPIMRLMRKMPFCERILKKYLDRAQEKLRPSVEKYGFWGLAVFIGIPLPLTGAYTGAMGAYALGMKRRKFVLANVAGVAIACFCVTLICLLLKAGVNLPFFRFLIKQ